MLTSPDEREEARLRRALHDRRRAITGPSTIAVLSPKGGVGKTTCAFVLGDLLARELGLRAIAVDTSAEPGTLGALAPDPLRAQRPIGEAGDVECAAELRPYLSLLPSGLHLADGGHTPAAAGELVGLLRRHYDAVILDLGPGITHPLGSLAIQSADQIVLVTTPDLAAAQSVLGALEHVLAEAPRPPVTVLVNQVRDEDVGPLEQRLRRQGATRVVTVPFDPRLRAMLESASYALPRLPRPTRIALERLGLAVAARLG